MPGGVDDELVERAENAAVPNDYRQLRACVRCHLVLPLKQFEKCVRPPLSPSRPPECPPARIRAARGLLMRSSRAHQPRGRLRVRGCAERPARARRDTAACVSRCVQGWVPKLP
jgi:hypothetical protein